VSLDILKLNKQLLTAMAEAGYEAPKEIQSKTMSRIIGGQDIIAVGPEGCGKTTTMVLAVLMKLKYAQDPPRALILVPDKESVLSLVEKFKKFSKNTDLRIIGIHAGVGMESQREDLAEGVDIIIGTPDRILTLYQKSGLNLSKIQMFILDDAELSIKQGFHTPVSQIGESLPKCQHLVFTEVVHEKLLRLTKPILNYPVLIEVSELAKGNIETIDQVLFQVPNYKSKQNLLNLMMSDAEEFSKVIVFVNTKITAETLYKSLSRRIMGQVAVLNAMESEEMEMGVDSIKDFKDSTDLRVLIIANEGLGKVETDGIPFLIHFDVPMEIDLFIRRIEKKGADEPEETLGITFATDIELSLVRKIEKEIGQKIPVDDLPPGVIIEGDRKKKVNEDPDKNPEQETTRGAAFHEKKESNSRDQKNYKFKDRLKLFGKKNRRNKKGEK
jgi:ATP-dependent RNA helicase RhlE